MKLLMLMFLGTALLTGCVAPAVASARPQYQTDQDRDRERNTQAYTDGYAQGQADARGHAIRNDQPTAQWTKDDDRRAYRQGYGAGYDDIIHGASAVSEPRMAHGNRQAEQFGYQDGLAAGRHDRMQGEQFKPHDHDLYKDGNHGWTAELGTKHEFKQVYREGFVRGYEEGYRETGPR